MYTHVCMYLSLSLYLYIYIYIYIGCNVLAKNAVWAGVSIACSLMVFRKHTTTTNDNNNNETNNNDNQHNTNDVD